MTLTEFLLARITEDELEARAAIAKRDSIAYTHPPLVPDMTLEAWEDVGVPAVLVGPERVLAECEAKRRIVALCDSHGDHDARQGNGITFAAASAFYDSVRALASVYSDHPDYRDEWEAAVSGEWVRRGPFKPTSRA